MREIIDHKLNGLNDALTINVLDEPGSGGANHEYEIGWHAGAPGAEHSHCGPGRARISFQNGPIKEAGVNGISGEALVAIVIDRLRCFQKGPYNTEDNAQALTFLEGALEALQRRTRERLARGVEGTNQK